ncbi:DUF3253 domain-containing protein [uncultured Hydrogenophaga sp.]|uniref:DUF3253 domain-containing protein n=1 Tax=uncultured Hydrogenophaga sp. TaxID=199683 RepID=UPI00258E31B8|nr:DUF3253 domain-containing protein [uncultured Hydrogenophaga sp.]
MTADPAEQAILDTFAQRGLDKSICPTEAARALAGHPQDESWRRSLAPVKLAAQRLARAGRIEILRKGKPVDPETLHGVIRLRLTRPEG